MQTTQLSFGDRLREERVRRDVALHDIAEATKIRVRYLEALEEGQHDRLPGFVFAKGYVRAYAETIGADVETLVEAFVQEQRELGRYEERESGEVLEALAAAVDHSPSPHTGRRLLPWLITGGVGLIVLIGIVGWMLAPASATPPADAPQPLASASAAESVAAIPQTVPDSQPEAIEPTIVKPIAEEPIVESEVIVESVPTVVTQPVDMAATETTTDSTIRVTEFGVGTEVRQRTLVGVGTTLRAGDQAVFWNRIVDGEKGDQVTHLWTLNGDAVRSIELNIGGPHWRTYSRVTLPSAGRWSVEARDESGAVLATESFVVASR